MYYSIICTSVSCKSSITIWSNNNSLCLCFWLPCTLARTLQFKPWDITAPPKPGSRVKLLTEPDTNTTDQEWSIVPPPQHPIVSTIPSCPWLESRCQPEPRWVRPLSPLMDAFERFISFCQPRETHNSDSQPAATQVNTTLSTTPSMQTHKKDNNIHTRVTFMPWWTVPEQPLGLPSPASVSEPRQDPASTPRDLSTSITRFGVTATSAGTTQAVMLISVLL